MYKRLGNKVALIKKIFRSWNKLSDYQLQELSSLFEKRQKLTKQPIKLHKRQFSV